MLTLESEEGKTRRHVNIRVDYRLAINKEKLDTELIFDILITCQNSTNKQLL